MTKNKIFLAVAGMAGISLILSAAVFAASGGIGGRPANPDPDNPRTQSIFLYTLKAGQTKSDQIFLSNAGDDPQTIELYAVDGVVTNTGSYTCKQESEAREDIGTWVTMSKREVTLPAHGTMNLDFKVVVPKDASVGEHNGCIAIQKKDDGGQVTGNLRIHTRQAVRIAVIVPGDIHRKVDIASFTAGTSRRGENYTVVLKNTGNVSADVDLKVRLKDVFGNDVYVNGGQQPVIANKSLELNYQGNLRPFFGGWYVAQATIAYDKRAGVYGTTDNSQLLTAESQKIVLFIWPSVWFFVLLGTLVVGGVGYLVWRRQGGRFAVKKSSGKKTVKGAAQIVLNPYEIQEGDTLNGIAEAQGIESERIAHLNKLSEPYELVPGDIIYIPQETKKRKRS